MTDLSRVLLISSDKEESSSFKNIFSEHGLLLDSIQSGAQLAKMLEDFRYDAVFCAWSFCGGTWSGALARVQQRHPDLPVVVFRRTGGEREWLEVLEAGAFDLVAAPYEKFEVLSVLEQALVSHEARRLHKAVPQLALKAG